MTRRSRVARFLGTSLLALTFAAQSTEASQAEYAIRWDPADGGPTSAAAALAKFGLADDKPDTFEIRYFTVSAAPDLPLGFKAIIRERERTSKQRYELMYKYRGQAPLPANPSSALWSCPVGATDKKKDEVDVSFRSLTDVARAYSRSCTVEFKDARPVIPKTLKAKPADCKNSMTRLKADKLAVEEWHLSNGRTIIEVSRSGAATKEDLEAFRNDIAKALVETHKIKPLATSMTELGSACGK